MFEMEFKFSKLVKSIAFVSESRKRLAPAQSTAYILRNRQGKQVFVKENEEKRNLNL